MTIHRYRLQVKLVRESAPGVRGAAMEFERHHGCNGPMFAPDGIHDIPQAMLFSIFGELANQAIECLMTNEQANPEYPYDRKVEPADDEEPDLSAYPPCIDDCGEPGQPEDCKDCDMNNGSLDE